MIKKSFTVIAGLDCVGKTSLYGILSGERIVTNNVDYSDTYCLDNNILPHRKPLFQDTEPRKQFSRHENRATMLLCTM